MEDITKSALLQSIKQWKEKRRLIVAHNYGAVDMGPKGCRLCSHFFCAENFANDCEGCPVQVYSGESYCNNTPYIRASHFFHNVRQKWNTGIVETGDQDHTSLLQAVDDQIAFLENLVTND